jgi:hypothetical protein
MFDPDSENLVIGREFAARGFLPGRVHGGAFLG